jgi:hypothetical protein
VVIRDTTIARGGVNMKLPSVLKVPRQCPLVLLVRAKHSIKIDFDLILWL